jgi:hypothetical protein
MCEQTVKCEGCGSKWVIIGVGNQIVARFVECPLCTEEKLEYFLGEFLLLGGSGGMHAHINIVQKLILTLKELANIKGSYGRWK